MKKAILTVVLLIMTVAVSVFAASSFQTPPVTPPANVHPRAFFSSEDIPEILSRKENGINAEAWGKHLTLVARSDSGVLSDGQYDGTLLGMIENKALNYALTGNAANGNSAVDMLENYYSSAAIEDFDYTAQGHLTYVIGVVYDWCYPLIDAEDKELWCDRIETLANLLESGYETEKQSSFISHAAESHVLRDLLTCAIAVYDERPFVWNNVAGRIYDRLIEERKFYSPAHMILQGSAYTTGRAQWDGYATFAFDNIGVPNLFGDNQGTVLDWQIYARRPDGQLLRDGDTNRENYVIGKYDTKPYRAAMLLGNYYHNPYYINEMLKCYQSEGIKDSNTINQLNCVDILLFNDPEEEARPHSELPLSKYFPSPKGGMIARTGWEEGFDSNTVVAEMKINEYNVKGHQHLDAGAFQIYYKGALATDSGFYQTSYGDTSLDTTNNGNTYFASEHYYNYYMRTIAHNAMLVYDPNELAENRGAFSKRTEGYSNDGGQKFITTRGKLINLPYLNAHTDEFKTGEVLAQEIAQGAQPDYTYLKGDLSYAYSDKVAEYERSFMFLNLQNEDTPAALLVFDRLVSSNSSFRKSWLVHGMFQPDINGKQITFQNNRTLVSNGQTYRYNGKMTINFLLPEQSSITVAGGEGQEFMVDGTDYPALRMNDSYQRANEGGGYRVEISPAAENTTDYFLNVIQVGDADNADNVLETARIDAGDYAGAVIGDRVVLFGKFKDRTNEEVSFDIQQEGDFKITVCDLEEGTWNILKNGLKVSEVFVTGEGGVASFSGDKGQYTLQMKTDDMEINTHLVSATFQGVIKSEELEGKLTREEIEAVSGRDTLLSYATISNLNPNYKVLDFGILLSKDNPEPEIDGKHTVKASVIDRGFSAFDNRMQFGILFYGTYIDSSSRYYVRPYIVLENDGTKIIKYGETMYCRE